MGMQVRIRPGPLRTRRQCGLRIWLAEDLHRADQAIPPRALRLQEFPVAMQHAVGQALAVCDVFASALEMQAEVH